ncbi:MAG: hypothetical protein IPK37_09920 [Austwickia sp.]|jgi:hypothetical protein|nr:MAG: hypothetical protein IPK37_09920 [Austwickia sp.]
MGKHYSEASERTAKCLFWLGVVAMLAAIMLGVATRSVGAWVVLFAIGLLGLAVAVWNRPRLAPPAGASSAATIAPSAAAAAPAPTVSQAPVSRPVAAPK